VYGHQGPLGFEEFPLYGYSGDGPDQYSVLS